MTGIWFEMHFHQSISNQKHQKQKQKQNIQIEKPQTRNISSYKFQTDTKNHYIFSFLFQLLFLAEKCVKV